MYCTPDDIRRECTERQLVNIDDDRLTELCRTASKYVDIMTGQWFEPRLHTVKLDGNGGVTLPLPFFLIRADSVYCDGIELSSYTLYNRMYPDDDRNYPRIKRKGPWRRGNLNVEVTGLWGYVDEDGSGGYMTPALIKKAVIRLVIMNLPLLGDVSAQEDKNTRNMIVSETTDGHSYTLDRSIGQLAQQRRVTGDPEIDQIINCHTLHRVGLGLI